ncbi:class I SAM-dependent methyltransferase [Nocardiopsis metallicus]|uniref:SAM-dependent methyltransferase n=1 Tax=Nocardiopsis metallicus TaxID=179819 RepID=A0A840WG85_9ACTN|nr:class I SAM-dependent methyltransferase [Nocardiopsis metallicus]MBB5492021.1 SAM-dependent methyltransferase [Nocardiopsis metallicus]
MYSDDDLAALYDALNTWAPCDDFYLSHVMAADAVLDVGCGTGMILRRAREQGHSGRLSGIDPDSPSLRRARSRQDVEWVEGQAVDIARRREWQGGFDLAFMASNAFQVFVTGVELRDSLAAIRTALRPGGRFVFGTRNPRTRAWESWTPENAAEVVDHNGRELRVEHRIESVADGVVTMTETTATRDGRPLRVDRGVLRFTSAEEIDRFLAAAGFETIERYGDWQRGPYTDASGEIITVARAV